MTMAMGWPIVPDGRLGTYTQRLQFTWTMTGNDGINHDFVSSMPSLTWSVYKVDSRNWEIK